MFRLYSSNPHRCMGTNAEVKEKVWGLLKHYRPFTYTSLLDHDNPGKAAAWIANKNDCLNSFNDSCKERRKQWDYRMYEWFMCMSQFEWRQGLHSFHHLVRGPHDMTGEQLCINADAILWIWCTALWVLHLEFEDKRSGLICLLHGSVATGPGLTQLSCCLCHSSHSSQEFAQQEDGRR